jgi:hypothetical protein
MNLFESFLDYQRGSSLMKIYIGMEQAKSPVFLNRLLHEVLGCAPTIILIIFFCNLNIFLLLDEFPPKKLFRIVQ